jgi:hypothetical protein
MYEYEYFTIFSFSLRRVTIMCIYMYVQEQERLIAVIRVFFRFAFVVPNGTTYSHILKQR